MSVKSGNNSSNEVYSKVSVDRIVDPLLDRAGVDLQILRLDQYDPMLSGNKYFKLKYNLQYAKQHGFKQVISFGGAYSNHIHALALAGSRQGISTLGIIRGEKLNGLNHTLRDAVDAGMELLFVDRKTYRLRSDNEYLDELRQRYPDSYIIPEGGGNLLGFKGCMDIVKVLAQSISDEFDLVAMPVGTGSTMAGVVAGMAVGYAPDRSGNSKILGISVLKNGQYLEEEVVRQLNELPSIVSSDSFSIDRSRWSINHDYHCGGYAKIDKVLAQFIHYFKVKHQVSIEPIYSGKLLLALYRLISKGLIKDKKIVAIHTGGLQGLRGMQERIDKYLVQERNPYDIDEILFSQ